ncbi:MAG TPA: hypothetical protein VNZ01_14120 [Solirubrobacteraceae bacterium]|jgi:hypothetical protein|nr:hypothetical protein [Solirubrobacteraceae bacterium]
MQICRLTVPGLSIRRDFEAARRRLLEGFPDVHEVVATTAPATLLVLYSGTDEVELWLDALLDSTHTRHGWATAKAFGGRDRSRGGADSAA